MLAVDVVQFFKPWAHVYGESKVLSAIVTGVHIAALTVGGGLAIAADRMTLRTIGASASDRSRQLEELHRVHRPVIISLTALFISGTLMATSDLGTFLPSPVFWLKLSLVTLLLINGALLKRTETGLRSQVAGSDGLNHPETAALWSRLRMTSWASLVLWGTTLATGVALANVS